MPSGSAFGSFPRVCQWVFLFLVHATHSAASLADGKQVRKGEMKCFRWRRELGPGTRERPGSL